MNSCMNISDPTLTADAPESLTQAPTLHRIVAATNGSEGQTPLFFIHRGLAGRPKDGRLRPTLIKSRAFADRR